MIFVTEFNVTETITGNETWVYLWDTQSEHQADRWRATNASRPAKPCKFSVEKDSYVHDFHQLQRCADQILQDSEQEVLLECYETFA